MISINYRDARPIYEQVHDGFLRLIITDGLPSGSKMPSVREIAASLAINPNTIQRAYRELEAEGYIVTVQGKGSFVAADSTALSARRGELTEKYRSLVTELKQAGADAAFLKQILEEEFRDD